MTTGPDRVEIVRSYYGLVDAGLVTELVALFDAECVYHRPGYAAIRGRSALEDFYRNVRVIVDGRHAMDLVLVDGDRVAVTGEFSGTLRDGSTTAVGFADFFTFGRDDRIRERRTYFEVPAV
jgi:ketosteroid isomerase-like protein